MNILICRLVNLLSNKLSRHSKAGFLTSQKRPLRCAIDRLYVFIMKQVHWTLNIPRRKNGRTANTGYAIDGFPDWTGQVVLRRGKCASRCLPAYGKCCSPYKVYFFFTPPCRKTPDQVCLDQSLRNRCLHILYLHVESASTNELPETPFRGRFHTLALFEHAVS